LKLTIATHDDQRMVVIQEAIKQFRKEHPTVVPNKTELIKQIMNGERCFPDRFM
jgi:hypothetical protein